MKRRSAGTIQGTAVEAAALPEHDYAHSVAVAAPGSSSTTEVEPAVGAEVECPAVTPVSRAGRRRPKRPEDENCSSCRFAFERQGRSFNRRAVFTFTTPETVQWVFPEAAAAHDKSFLCETCAQVIRGRCRRKQTGKRALWLIPPPVGRDPVDT